MNPSKITIFIVDDHPLMRQALKAAILAEADMEVVGLATDGAEAVKAIPHAQPDVVIMDLMMPNMDGLSATLTLSQVYPDAHILALSSQNNEEAIFKAVQAGARGYLTKDVQHEELMEAIRLVSAGKSYLPKSVAEKLMGGVRQSLVEEKNDLIAENRVNAFDTLTRRENETLVLLGKGYSNAKISATMVISESTVRVYLHQIMKKMEFENRREAVVFLARLELEK